MKIIKDKREVQRDYEKRTGYAAVKKYQASNIQQMTLKFNKNTDQDILEKLNTVPSKQGYVKKLIRKDISKSE